MLTIACCRVSTKAQAEEGFSIEGQADKLRAYSTLRDLGEVTVLTDPGRSGKDMLRPRRCWSGRPTVRRAGSRWVTTVNACYTQQLAVTRSGPELLADRSSPYPLLSRTMGTTTCDFPFSPNWAHPAPPGSLALATNGELVTGVQTSNGRQRLFLLRPSASSWCEVQGVLNVGLSQLVSSLRTSGDDLLWGQNQNTTSGTSPIVTRHIVAVNDLHC
jgi:hypothetical protein